MRISFRAFWMQKAGNASEEYEDAFAPAGSLDDDGDHAEFRCAVADGATETSFSGLWAKILVDAYTDDRLHLVKQETLTPLAANWHESINARTAAAPLPWYAQEKLERGAFSSLMGLTLRADGRWRALCVGDSCLFHIRPHQPIRAFPYHHPDQFNNRPTLISTHTHNTLEPLVARGQWHEGDTFLLMTDALAQFFLAYKARRDSLTAAALDQAGFEALVDAARSERLCKNDDVTLVKITPVTGDGQRGMA